MQVMSADLSAFSLGTLLQAAESDRLSGEMRFEPEGSIVLHDGSVVDAVFGRLSGVDAALTLLMVRSKHVVVEQYAVDPRPPLLDTMALIIDGARMNDDWATLAPRVLKVRDDLDQEPLSKPLRRALKALNGKRIVEEAIEIMGVDLITVLDDLLDLRERRDLIEVAPPRPREVKVGTATPAPVRTSSDSTPETPTDVSDFYTLIDESRVALRAKQHARALEILERARALRPEDPMVLQNIRLIRKFINQA